MGNVEVMENGIIGAIFQKLGTLVHCTVSCVHNFFQLSHALKSHGPSYPSSSPLFCDTEVGSPRQLAPYDALGTASGNFAEKEVNGWSAVRTRSVET